MSNPLKSLERVKGIEPSSSAWKAVALPLSYTRIGNQSSGPSLERTGPSCKGCTLTEIDLRTNGWWAFLDT
jgi:hypothetical protein